MPRSDISMMPLRCGKERTAGLLLVVKRNGLAGQRFAIFSAHVDFTRKITETVNSADRETAIQRREHLSNLTVIYPIGERDAHNSNSCCRYLRWLIIVLLCGDDWSSRGDCVGLRPV